MLGKRWCMVNRELINPFQENKISFCTRMLNDVNQLEYLVNILKFSKEVEFQTNHINDIREYLLKIENHLKGIESLDNKKAPSSEILGANEQQREIKF